MPVYIYDQNGLVEERPETAWKQSGRDIYEHNKINPEDQRSLLVGPSFPPFGYIFDPTIGNVRPRTIQERVDFGEFSIPNGFTIQTAAHGEVIVSPFEKIDSNGMLVSKSIEEQVAEELVAFDPARQKIVGGTIVAKSSQELLDSGQLSFAELRDTSINRLRAEVEQHFAAAQTANGYRLDNLARQKAAISLQYRNIADTDPQKAALLASKVIYSDAITDEILAAVESVQAAYDLAKAAIETCFAQAQPVANFEAVTLNNYLGS